MTVKELINILKKVQTERFLKDQDMTVFISTEEELFNLENIEVIGNDLVIHPAWPGRGTNKYKGELNG